MEELEILEQVARDDIDFLEERINEFNYDATDIRDGRELGIFVRDGDGTIVAGLYGWTWGACLQVEYLWVAAAMRGRDYGTRLLRAAEAEARSRGCVLAVLDTHSFQAPKFYARLGYAVVGTVDGYPRGHAQHYLSKPL